MPTFSPPSPLSMCARLCVSFLLCYFLWNLLILSGAMGWGPGLAASTVPRHAAAALTRVSCPRDANQVEELSFEQLEGDSRQKIVAFCSSAAGGCDAITSVLQSFECARTAKKHPSHARRR